MAVILFQRSVLVHGRIKVTEAAVQVPGAQLGALLVHHSIRRASTFRKPLPVEITHEGGRQPEPLSEKRP